MKHRPANSPKPNGRPAVAKPKELSWLATLPDGFWFGLLLVCATVAAYWPVFANGFIWDDDGFVTQNPTLRDLDGLRQIWFNPAATLQYYPLVHTSFWLEYHLWRLQPVGFHVVNVLLHALAALLLWRVLLRLKLPGAWFMAAVFALHPVQTESVAWVTERKNVLSAVFYFSAALCYFRFAGIGVGADEVKRRDRYYFAALLLFLGALLSKTVVCSLPAALLLVLWWKKERLEWRDILPLGPFFAFGGIVGVTTPWLETHLVKAQGADWSLTFAERCLIAGRALWFYAGKLVWPSSLTFIYPRWDIHADVWWQWLFPAAGLLVVAVLWLARHKLGRGPLVAVLFFSGTLLPALGFINVYPMRFSFVADHFQYLASIGIIVLVVVIARRLLERLSVNGQQRTGLAALVLAALGVLTWQQSHIYQNLETLWIDTLAKNPACWMAHSNLGRLLAQKQEYALAETHYQAALVLKPEEEAIHYNYGNLLARTGRFAQAVTQYRQALQIAPEKAATHNNLGFALNQQHSTDDAIAEYEQAIFYDPGFADAYYNLGNALSAENKMDAAIRAYRHALQLEPDSERFRKRLLELAGFSTPATP
jgi:tetratricopeptide (TPR) repeat protein